MGEIAKHENYYNHYQLPIFCVLLAILWTAIGIRLWGIRRSNHLENGSARKNFTFKNASAVLIVLAGLIFTLYVGFLIADFILNKRITTIRGTLIEPGDEPPRDPSTYSDAEYEVIIRSANALFYTTTAGGRITLTIALWMVKLAFVAIFLDSRHALNRGFQWCLYATAFIVFGSLIAAVAVMGADYHRDIGQIPITVDIIKQGGWIDGVRFFLFGEPSTEYTLTGMNIATDFLLTSIAIRLVLSLRTNGQVSLSSVCLLLLMVAATVSVAVARLLMVYLTFNDQNTMFSHFLTIPTELLSELETWLGAVVSCLPGIRVWVRTLRDRRKKKPEDDEVKSSREVPSLEIYDFE